MDVGPLSGAREIRSSTAMIRPPKRTGMFSTGTCSLSVGWWMLPRMISPEWKHCATRAHWDSLTV